jgi:hypothetical protein
MPQTHLNLTCVHNPQRSDIAGAGAGLEAAAVDAAGTLGLAALSVGVVGGDGSAGLIKLLVVRVREFEISRG